MVKNERDLCDVCGEEPARPVSDLWRRIRETCVRFVEKNQRGLCEIGGEESERPVWGLWRRIREACERLVLKALSMRHVSVRIFRFPVACYHLAILRTHTSITHQMDNGPI